MDETQYEGINPELIESSDWVRGVVSMGDELITTGIDPATAAVIVAAVPITLRLLRMSNEVLSAFVDDLREKNRLRRKKEEADLEIQIERDKKAAEKALSAS